VPAEVTPPPTPIPPFASAAPAYHLRLDGARVPLGFGCATIGAADDDAEARATLDLAYESGFRYFDAAAAYGAAESRLGGLLGSVDRSDVFVATKSGVPGGLSPTEAARAVRGSLVRSLERLQIDSVDMFLVHDVTSLETTLAPGGVLDALLAARDEGLVTYVGLGTRPHALLQRAASHGSFDAVLTFLDYSLLDRSAADLIEHAASRGVGAIVGSPLAFGLLTGGDPRATRRWEAVVRPMRDRAAALYEFCMRERVPLLALALRYPGLNPSVSLTLTAPGSRAELASTLAALRRPVGPALWQRVSDELGIPLPCTGGAP
jgi:aryl-alcohol dehydrogenase-like predicted oxidoreductase